MIVFDNIKSATASKVSDAEIEKAAAVYGLNKNHVKAVLMVESGGSGFYPSKRPRILFEAQLFSKATNHQYDTSHPNISSSKWDRTLYSKHSEDEYNRLKEAMALNSEAALKSASFGLLQILGQDFRECGCASVNEFVQENCKDEINQISLFLKYIHSRGLVDSLKNQDWARFASHYNGPNYTVNHYDENLKANFEKLSKP